MVINVFIYQCLISGLTLCKLLKFLTLTRIEFCIMLLTEQGDKVFFDRKDDMFEMHILPKDQMEEDGKPIQDVMQFGLKPTSAKKAFNRLKRKQRYKTSDGETSVWLADNKLNFKFDAPYFPQSFQVSFGYFLC